MSEELNRSELPSKAWSPLYIGIISYFCFILPGVILMAINYGKLGRNDLRRRALFIGIIVFVLLVVLFSFLPSKYDWLTTSLHIGAAFAIAGIQYRLFAKARENNPGWKTESILIPALLSLVFLIVPIGIIILRNEYLFKKEKEGLRISKDFFEKKDYQNAIHALKNVRDINPQQQLSYVNAAIAYDAMGKKDSAKLVLKQWLEIAPDDSEAQELLRSMN